LAHDISETLVDLYQQTEARFYAILLVILTILLNSFSVGSCLFLYISYAQDSTTLLLNTCSLLTSLTQTILSVLPQVQDFNPRSGILQPAIVSFYNFYLLLSATLLNKPLPWTSDKNPWLSACGIIMTFLSLGYSAMTSGVKSAHLSLKDSIESGPLITAESESSNDILYNFSFFHFIFILASCYAALVLTSWQEPVLSASHPYFSTQTSPFAYWARIVSSWLVSLLYMLTLFAPKMFPDRDFGFD
jgi:serine incorporator 1/3